MKARVKTTGEIVEVKSKVITSPCTGNTILKYVDQNKGISYFEEDLDFDIEGKFAENCLNGIKQDIVYEPDYWTRLEHQYAGMAMQGMLSNPEVDLDYKSDECMPQAVAATAYNIAHALIQKLKEKEERK